MTGRALLNPDIFRAYDIRGIVGPGFDEQSVRLIGQGIGSEALAIGERTLFCACDARLSSPALAAALREGLYNSGVHVIDLGVVPTPLLYFATHTQACGSGVMLTGSHNPRDYNGLKIVLKKHTLADNQIQRIRERIDNNELTTGKGWHSYFDIAPLYLQTITADIRLQRQYKVVIDAGNGVGGLIATTLFRQLGCEVIPLFCEPDGNFPNHHPDPTRAENLVQLQAAIALQGADLGIALDGDADRIGIVTASGHALSADHLLLAFAMDILPENPDARIVFDVKSSHHLPNLITAHGGKPIMCKSGHSFVKQKIYETDALLGGEFSAHIFFKHRWFGFDDGIYTAARFLELMDKGDTSADMLLEKMPCSYSTPELFAPIAEEDKFAVMATLTAQLHFADATLELLDGVRVDFTDGWALIRASNTTANLVLRVEADTEAALARIQQQFRRAVLAIVPTLALPF
jgi:phosphomannomutase / phosphoglucomutase